MGSSVKQCHIDRIKDEKQNNEEGPIKIIKPEEVSKEPAPLPEGFEWVVMELTDEKEVLALPILPVLSTKVLSAY